MGKALIMSECDFSSANVGNIKKDLITIELTAWPGAVQAVASSPVYSQVTIQLADIGAIILPAGETSAILGISASEEERIVSANISSSEYEYSYALTNDSINIPQKPDTDIRLVSTSNEDYRGSKEGAIFTLLNYKTAKQVVGTPDELTDEFKEYFGPITWQLIPSNGNEDVLLETNEGTRGIVDIYKNANAEIHAHVMGNLISNDGMRDFFYEPAHFNISTFEDLLAVEYAVNNGKESELQLAKPQDAPNTTFENGSGFAGAIFRITNDIDCLGRHVEIGQYNTSLSRNHVFSGTIDGCFHTLKNIGGNAGIAGTAAEGGEVGSILIRHGKNAVVKNLRFEGSVSNITPRGYGGIIAMVEGICYIRAVYNAVSVYVASDDITSSQVGMAGWQILGGKCNISESVFAGTNRAHFTVSGFQSCKGNHLQNCLMIGALECIVTTRNNSNIVSFDGEGAMSGNQTVNCAAIGKYKQVGSNFKQMCVTYGQCQGAYECLLIESDKAVSTFSNHNTVADIYSVNNFQNSTKVTPEQLRSGTLLNWDFVTEGFLPLPKGFFLTEPLVLSRIKYGYTENN